MGKEGMMKDTDDATQNQLGFYLSIILSLVGILLITLMILFAPTLEEVFSNPIQQPLEYNNFFYKWTYTQWNDSYDLASFKPAIGYYIFTPFIGLMLFVSNSGLLIKSVQKNKQLMAINWGLYSLPIAAFIIKISIIGVNNEIAMPFYEVPLLVTIGFYVLIYLPLQIMLRIENKTFREYFALQKRNEKMDDWEIRKRRIIAIFTAVIYLYAMGLFYHSAYSEKELFTVRNKFVVVISLLMWFIVNVTIYTYKSFSRSKKNIISFLSGTISFLTICLTIYIAKPLILIDIMSFNVDNIEFPFTFVMVIFSSSLILLVSFPVGFYSYNKKDTALTTIPFLCFIVAIGIMLIFVAVFNAYDITQGTLIFLVLIRIYYLLLFFAGAYWGRFLGSKIFDLKQNK